MHHFVRNNESIMVASTLIVEPNKVIIAIKDVLVQEIKQFGFEVSKVEYELNTRNSTIFRGPLNSYHYIQISFYPKSNKTGRRKWAEGADYVPN